MIDGSKQDNFWDDAFLAIKKVWASKWGERAYYACRRAEIPHQNVNMAVLVQPLVSVNLLPHASVRMKVQHDLDGAI